jgi:hypothetical protein
MSFDCVCSALRMRLAGVELSNESVVELCSMLRDEFYFKAADTLERALLEDRPEDGLTIRERTAILDVLDDAREELAQLRDVLMAEHEWRLSVVLVAGRVR